MKITFQKYKLYGGLYMSSVITTTKGATSQSSNIYLQDGKSISKDSNSAEYLVRMNNNVTTTAS